MTPTMSEYFEAWKNSRFVAGDKATEKGFVARSRLEDIGDILGGLVLIYDNIQPRSPKVDPAAGGADRRSSGRAARLRRASCATRRRAASSSPPRTPTRSARDAQEQAEAIAGQVSQAAGKLNIELERLGTRARCTPRRRCDACVASSPLAGGGRGARVRGRRGPGDGSRGRPRDALQRPVFDAQTELVLVGAARRGRRGARGARGLRRRLRGAVAAADPAADARSQAAWTTPRARRASDDDRALAAARGASAPRSSARRLRRHARRRRPRRRGRPRGAGCCCASSAPPPASRAPGADATLALEQLARGQDRAEAAAPAVDEGPARRLPGAPARAARRRRRGAEHDFPARRAEAAAQAAGYFAILAPRYAEDRGAAAARACRRARSTRWRRAAAGRDRRRRGARRRATRALDGFTAAPFTARGGRPPRPAAAALPRARAGRVRPRRRRARRSRATSRSRRPSPSAPARRPPSPTCATQLAKRDAAAHAGGRRRRSTELGGSSSDAPQSARTASRRAEQVEALTGSAPRTRSTPRCRRRGRRRPTSPTTT